MDLFDHPGNLGPSRGTLLTIHHADWPAYPQGDDFRTALLQLTAFPPGTDFQVIDNIDRSALLIARVRGAKHDVPLSRRNFHIAIWYEDLIELDRRAFIEGITRVTERAWHQDQWQRLLSEAPAGARLGYRGPGGEFVPLESPDFEMYEDEPDSGDFVVFRNDRLKVTPAGRSFLLKELSECKVETMSTLGERVAELFERRYYDTCIREACVHLEHDLRKVTQSENFGDRLVERFIEAVRDKQSHLESDIRTLRQELRAAFQFIRNDVMHNLREADSAATLAVLFRIAKLRLVLSMPARLPSAES